MKLISMREFVLEQQGKQQQGERLISRTLNELRLMYNYANFLNRKLEFGYFVPCVDGVPIKENDYRKLAGIKTPTNYKKAQPRVLFKGFELVGNKDDVFNFISFCETKIAIIYTDSRKPKFKDEFETIEDIENNWVGLEVELTETAIKELRI